MIQDQTETVIQNPKSELMNRARHGYQRACELAGYRLDLRLDVELCQALNLSSADDCDAIDRACDLYGATEVMR